MLESALLATASPRARRSGAASFSIALHAAAAAALLAASLGREERLDAPEMPVVFAGIPRGSPRPAGSRPDARGAERTQPAASRASVSLPAVLPAARALPPLQAPGSDGAADADADGGAAGVPGGAGDGNDGAPAGAGGGGGDADGPLVPGGDVRAPALVFRAEPDYPELARKTRTEGVVILEAIIGADGAVEEIRAVRSASPLLEDAARRAVARWRYRPATLNGRPVRVYLAVTVDFRLR